MPPKTLLSFGFPDTTSPRFQNLQKEYRDEGWDIEECLTTKKGFFGKHIDLYKKFRKSPKADAILVHFPGYYLMPLAWILTRFPRKKIIFDAFISISDTLVSDRKKVSWLNPLAWFYYLSDIASTHLADTVLIDTEAHKKFFASRFFLSPKNIRVSYVGTRPDLFFPGKKESKLPRDKYNVLFIGSYIPLQGIEYILHAADILRDQSDIHFTLIGGGQTYQKMATLKEKLKLSNVTFLDFMPIAELPKYLRSADIALGIFGTSDKASRVIPHKVYDAVACNIPVITAKNLAIEERFTNGKEVFLCNAGDAEDIAKTIITARERSR